MNFKEQAIDIFTILKDRRVNVRSTNDDDKPLAMTGLEIAAAIKDGTIPEKDCRRILEQVKGSLTNEITTREELLSWYKESIDLLDTSYNASKEIGRERHKEFYNFLFRKLKLRNGMTIEEADKLISPYVAAMTVASIAKTQKDTESLLPEERDRVIATTSRLRAKVMPFTVGTAAWGLTGFPDFSLTDDFFHSIAATDFGDAGDEVLKFPFPAFTIRLPPNEILYGCRNVFVYSFGYENDQVEYPKAHVTAGSENAGQVIFELPQLREEGKTPFVLQSTWKLGDSINLGEEKLTPFQEGTAYNIKKQQLAYSAVQLVRRVVLNTLLYINANNGLPEKGEKKIGPEVPVERDHKELPRFRIGRPIKLGPSIRKMLYHRAPTDQARELMNRFMVRGHWRNQAHGPKLTLRKRMWIEPYWKGPEDVTEALLRSYEVE